MKIDNNTFWLRKPIEKTVQNWNKILSFLAQVKIFLSSDSDRIPNFWNEISILRGTKHLIVLNKLTFQSTCRTTDRPFPSSPIWLLTALNWLTEERNFVPISCLMFSATVLFRRYNLATFNLRQGLWGI